MPLSKVKPRGPRSKQQCSPRHAHERSACERGGTRNEPLETGSRGHGAKEGAGARVVVQFGGLAARQHIRQLPSSPGNCPRAIGICRTPLVYHSVVE